MTDDTPTSSQHRDPALGGQGRPNDDAPSLGGDYRRKEALSGLSSEEWIVRLRAAEALGQLCDPHTIDELAAALYDWRGPVRKAAAAALTRIGVPAVPALLSAVEQGDGVTGKAAIGALLAIGPEAMPAAVETYHRSTAQSIKRAVIHLIGELRATEHIALLTEALVRAEVPDWEVVGALRAIGLDAAPLLIQLVNSDEATLRKHAIDLLGSYQYLDAIPLILARLNDADWSVRSAAITALASMRVQEAVPILLSFLEDDDEDLRDAAAHALGRIDGRDVTQHLIRRLEHETSHDVRRSLINALGQIGRPEVVPVLAAIYDEEIADLENSYTAETALNALGNSKQISAVPIIARALMHEEHDIIDAAYNALFELEREGYGKEVADAFAQAAVDTHDLDLRYHFLLALEQIAHPVAVHRLIRCLNDSRYIAYWNYEAPAQTSAEQLEQGPEHITIGELAARVLERIGTQEAVTAVRTWRSRSHPA